MSDDPDLECALIDGSIVQVNQTATGAKAHSSLQAAIAGQQETHAQTIGRSRLISLRLFGADERMVDADVLQGDTVCDTIITAFEDPKISYAHLYCAKPGCFAGMVTRPI